MASVVDQDQQWLLNCLSATLDANHEVRSFAEASLHQASLQPGFGSALAKVAANRELPYGLRQLAAVLLKQFIRKHWQEGEEFFEQPLVLNDEKVVIRNFLLMSLDDSQRKICTAISMAVASIAVYDWPEDWPELLPHLLKLMDGQTNMNGVQGALRCLALLSGDLDDAMVPMLVPVLFPCLHKIVSTPQTYDKYLRAKALSIVHSCFSMLGVMSGIYKNETSQLIKPMLKTWMDEFSIILGEPVPSEDPDDWSLRMEVLKCLNQLIQNFPNLDEGEFMIIMGPLWQTFVSSQKVYVQSAVEGAEDAYEGRYDSDGAEKSLDSFVIQLFELMLTIAGSSKFAKVITNSVKDLVYHTLPFLQITEQQMREATLFALASVSEQLVEAEVSGLTGGNLGKLIEQMISQDNRTGVNEYPFLYARVFTSVAKFSSLISHEVLESLLFAAVKAVSMDVPPPVKVGACHALSELLPKSNEEIIHSHMMELLSSLINLLSQASDETLHLVLETIQSAITAGCNVSTAIEPIISPVLLTTWASHVSDPFVSSDTIEVLEAIKNSPGCFHPLVSRVIPFIAPILSKPQQQPDGLVASSLDLLTMLLKNAPADAVKSMYDLCFDAVIRITLQSEDHGEMQNATECLAAFISVGRQEVLAWGGDSGFAMRCLLDVASRLLDPALESSGSLFVGNYILQLILHLPSQMSQHIWNLVAALVRRLQSAQIAGLRCSLILIFARLVHMSAPNVEQFINMLITVPAEGYGNAFIYVMSEWTKLQGEIQGSYQIKVTTTALALLLSTMHSELEKINVQGQLIQSSAGITTRSKAKSAPDQWTMVPLPVKIMALLADALIEIQEQVVAGDDEDDSDWEEVEAGDNGMENDILYSTAAISSSRPGYEHLEAMARFYNEDDEEDDLFSATDPINEINLANYITGFLVKFSQSNRDLFGSLYQNLNQSQRKAIQAVIGEIQGSYQIKVTTTALALLLSTMHSELEKINVQGQLIQSSAGITTRSKAKSAPDQWTMVPLPVKIMALLADALIEIQEQVVAGDDEDDSDWEEVEAGDNGMENDILYSTAAISSSRPGYEHLEAMARFYNEDDEEDDLFSATDPINEINLANYITGFLVKFSQSNRDLFGSLYQNLNQSQRKAIQAVIGEIQGSYQIKVTTTALALLLSTMHSELEKINVQGQLIQSSAGITTRSKAKSAPDQWTMVPLPVKIMALLADALIEIQEQVVAGDDEDDSDWEEVEAGDNGMENDILYSTAAISSSRPGYEHLEAMARFYNEDDEEDDLFSATDPINEINLANYITGFLVKFSQSNRDLFGSLYQNLNQSQRKAIQAVIGEIQGSYQIKVTTTALALLLSTMHSELEKINVQGQLIQSSAGITTRSKAKSAPDQWTMVPLPVKIMALLADALIEIQEQVVAGDDEDDSDWEEVEAGDNGMENDILYSTAAISSSRPGYEHLEAMARFYNEDDEEDDLFSATDPINEINLANYITGFLVKFSQSNRDLFGSLYQNLNQSQRKAIQAVIDK